MVPIYSVLHTNAVLPCEVGTTPFGVFDPAPGSIVEDGTYVTVFCNPATHTADNSVLVARCSNGQLTSTSSCIPCPDDSWVFDATTNRCFKGVAAIPSPFGPCDPATPCIGIGLSYGDVPGGLAYTSNLPALIEAGKIAVLSTVSPNNQYAVGISDSSSQSIYKLLDGTPLSLADLNPLFVSGQPDDTPANTQTKMVIRSGPNSVIGFDDVQCDPSFGVIYNGGVLLTDFLAHGETICGPYYAALIEQLYSVILEKRCRKISCELLLLHGNAPVHKCHIAQAAVCLVSFIKLNHQAYSLDTAPTYYYIVKF
uniref:Sushi domain-containing protein n=1 Tax=Plectus sambesii TaxID=2011161 RepID=A0A914WDI5_9BILA